MAELTVGQIVDGYRYNGGDKNDPNNWELATQEAAAPANKLQIGDVVDGYKYTGREMGGPNNPANWADERGYFKKWGDDAAAVGETFTSDEARAEMLKYGQPGAMFGLGEGVIGGLYNMVIPPVAGQFERQKDRFMQAVTDDPNDPNADYKQMIEERDNLVNRLENGFWSVESAEKMKQQIDELNKAIEVRKETVDEFYVREPVANLDEYKEKYIYEPKTEFGKGTEQAFGVIPGFRQAGEVMEGGAEALAENYGDSPADKERIRQNAMGVIEPAVAIAGARRPMTRKRAGQLETRRQAQAEAKAAREYAESDAGKAEARVAEIDAAIQQLPAIIQEIRKTAENPVDAAKRIEIVREQQKILQEERAKLTEEGGALAEKRAKDVSWETMPQVQGVIDFAQSMRKANPESGARSLAGHLWDYVKNNKAAFGRALGADIVTSGAGNPGIFTGKYTINALRNAAGKWTADQAVAAYRALEQSATRNNLPKPKSLTMDQIIDAMPMRDRRAVKDYLDQVQRGEIPIEEIKVGGKKEVPLLPAPKDMGQAPIRGEGPVAAPKEPFREVESGTLSGTRGQREAQRRASEQAMDENIAALREEAPSQRAKAAEAEALEQGTQKTNLRRDGREKGTVVRDKIDMLEKQLARKDLTAQGRRDVERQLAEAKQQLERGIEVTGDKSAEFAAAEAQAKGETPSGAETPAQRQARLDEVAERLGLNKPKKTPNQELQEALDATSPEGRGVKQKPATAREIINKINPLSEKQKKTIFQRKLDNELLKNEYKDTKTGNTVLLVDVLRESVGTRESWNRTKNTEAMEILSLENKYGITQAEANAIVKLAKEL